MTEPAPTGGWRRAVVREVMHPSARAVALRLQVDDRIDHLPGQHYVVRLTAEDGYTASRSYSLASPPSDPLIELFVARLEYGEVSGYLADVVQPGDELDIRGPIGGWFVWDATAPAFGIGGGTGIVPLVSMLRHAQATGRTDLLHLVAAARTLDDLPYAEEVISAGATVVLSRAARGDRAPGRLMASDVATSLRPGTRAYVCGSATFAEAASRLLVDLGVPPADVRVERFGPSAG